MDWFDSLALTSVAMLPRAHGGPWGDGWIRRETQDEPTLRKGCAIVRDTILNRYYKEYGSIICRDVLRKFFGKTWDLSDDAESNDFLQISQGCTIIQTAVWTTEIILDELEKGHINPLPGN